MRHPMSQGLPGQDRVIGPDPRRCAVTGLFLIQNLVANIGFKFEVLANVVVERGGQEHIYSQQKGVFPWWKGEGRVL